MPVKSISPGSRVIINCCFRPRCEPIPGRGAARRMLFSTMSRALVNRSRLAHRASSRITDLKSAICAQRNSSFMRAMTRPPVLRFSAWTASIKAIQLLIQLAGPVRDTAAEILL